MYRNAAVFVLLASLMSACAGSAQGDQVVRVPRQDRKPQPPSVVAVLADALEDGDEDVVVAATWALGVLSTEQLSFLPDKAISRLVNNIKEAKDGPLQFASQKTLVKAGCRSVIALIAGMKVGGEAFQRRAAVALGDIELGADAEATLQEQRIVTLGKTLESKHDSVVVAASQALSRMKPGLKFLPRSAIKVAISKLGNEMTKDACSYLLVRIGERALPDLIFALRDKKRESSIRTEVVSILGHIAAER